MGSLANHVGQRIILSTNHILHRNGCGSLRSEQNPTEGQKLPFQDVTIHQRDRGAWTLARYHRCGLFPRGHPMYFHCGRRMIGQEGALCKDDCCPSKHDAAAAQPLPMVMPIGMHTMCTGPHLIFLLS